MKRIGLFGGSFNPPHLGHLAMARNLHDKLNCDEVWMLVTPHNPFKDANGYAGFDDRLAMCHLLAEGYDWLKPSDIEKGLGDIHTANTLRVLRERYPEHEFVWSMGADNVQSFHQWEGWETIVSNHPVVLFSRPGYKDFDNCTAITFARQRDLVVANINDNSSGNLGFYLCQNEELDISSSEIKRSLIRKRTDCPVGLPESIYQYIIRHGLFVASSVQPQVKTGNLEKAP